MEIGPGQGESAVAGRQDRQTETGRQADGTPATAVAAPVSLEVTENASPWQGASEEPPLWKPSCPHCLEEAGTHTHTHPTPCRAEASAGSSQCCCACLPAASGDLLGTVGRSVASLSLVRHPGSGCVCPFISSCSVSSGERCRKGGQLCPGKGASQVRLQWLSGLGL